MLALNRQTGSIHGHDSCADHTADERLQNERDMQLAERIGVWLKQEYPGHFLGVEVISWGGIIRIFHPLLPKMYAYNIRLSEFNSDPGWKCVSRGVGEILERFNLPRGKYRSDLFREASRKHHLTKLGIFPWRVDYRTGKAMRVLPDELT